MRSSWVGRWGRGAGARGRSRGVRCPRMRPGVPGSQHRRGECTVRNQVWGRGGDRCHSENKPSGHPFTSHPQNPWQ